MNTEDLLKQWHMYAEEIRKKKAELETLRRLQNALFKQLPDLWCVEGTGYHGTIREILWVAKTYIECREYVTTLGYAISNGSDYQFVPANDPYPGTVAGNISSVNPTDSDWPNVFEAYGRQQSKTDVK